MRDHLCLLPQLNTRVCFSLGQEKRAVDMLEGSLVSGILRTGYPIHSWEPSCSGPTALPSIAVVRKLMSAHHLLSWPLMIKWTYLGCDRNLVKLDQTHTIGEHTASLGNPKEGTWLLVCLEHRRSNVINISSFLPLVFCFPQCGLPFAGSKADPWQLLVF